MAKFPTDGSPDGGFSTHRTSAKTGVVGRVQTELRYTVPTTLDYLHESSPNWTEIMRAEQVISWDNASEGGCPDLLRAVQGRRGPYDWQMPRFHRSSSNMGRRFSNITIAGPT